MSARPCALKALTLWENNSVFADALLRDLAEQHRLSSADRALAQEIFYGVLRHLTLLDTIIDHFRDGRTKAGTRNTLRVGVFQLLFSEIADHAAIHETVSLARGGEKGLINAVLRQVQRQRKELLEEIPELPADERWSHPQHLIERWTGQHGESAAHALCEWNNTIPVNYARINPLARDTAAREKIESEIEPCPLPSHDFPETTAPVFFPFHHAPPPEWLESGLIYVQDPSTSLACRLLDPQPGEAVLDACAAPGGKTSLLAAMMQNEGTLIAADSAPQRIKQLQSNLERMAVNTKAVLTLDWENPGRVASVGLPQFDAILLDVPCTNTGVMRRRVDVRWRLMPHDFSRMAELQRSILSSVVPFLKPGGRIVYSTCSVDQEENETVVRQSGLTVERMLHSLPWRDGYDGAFAALLRR